MALLRDGSNGDAVRQLQERLAERGFDPGGIDGDFGPLTEKAVEAFQASEGLVVDGVAGPETLGALGLDGRPIIVLDPGHGGFETVAGSSWNNAVSASGVLEKHMTLELAFRIRDALLATPDLRVVMTRATDVNLGLSARANVARDRGAELFVSLHFNGFDGRVRGVETFVRGDLDHPLHPHHGNYNFEDDRAFAQRLQSATLRAVRARDGRTKDRKVKAARFGVLSDPQLGNTPEVHPCKACLVEVEFIDVPEVDELLNTGANAEDVRQEIAEAIAGALRVELGL